MDVQKGVSELEELLDIIGDYRKNWKSAEAEKGKEERKTVVEKAVPTPQVCHNVESLPQKRTATSPAEKPTPGKKRKGINQKMEPRKETNRESEKTSNKVAPDPPKGKPADRREIRKRMPKSRPIAVVVKPGEGHSYAEVLKRLKDNVKPQDADITVRSIRKTRAGAILLELARGGKVEQFSEAIKDSLKETAEVRDLKPKTTIEIRDIDCTTTEEDVMIAVCEKTEANEENITVRLTNLNSRDQRRAFVVLPTDAAKKLLKTERIKIGWTNCELKLREEDRRCFTCFGLAHGQWNCKGPDRKAKGICIQCGKEGHILKQCQNPPNCCLCTEQGKSPTNHLPGSRSCKAERQA